MAVALSLVVPCLAAVAADEPGFIFFGVVTVREGKTVLFQNSDLTEEQVKTCKEALKRFIKLDRTYTTSKDKEGELTYKWGDDEGTLSEGGLVPYIAYFVTPDQFIQIDKANAQPRAQYMTFQRSSTIGFADLRWWAPETTEKCDLSLEYYDDSSYNVIAVLKDDKIAVGTGGTSPDGVNWKIASIEEKEREVVINVETDKGPEGHEFVFWIATKKFKIPRQDSPWTKESEDGEKLIYPASHWAKNKADISHFEIRERHPDRIKKWETKGFRLKAK